MDSIKVISKQDNLASICEEIDQLGRFALDLEFIPEKTFNPVLALLQIATDKAVYIIDPCSNVNLDMIWQKVADQRIRKILHAAKEDLNIIRQLSNVTPVNIFDTQVAAGFLGFGYPAGYKKLLDQVLGIQINKSESFTDWLIRPLSNTQLQYAYEDVCHLLLLADKLTDLLKEKGRLNWATEECALLFTQQVSCDLKDYSITKIKGARSLSRQKLAVLQALCNLRLVEARRTNKPLKAILSDMTLLELAKKLPNKAGSFEEMRGINLDQAKRYCDQIIASIHSALSLPQSDWPIWPSIPLMSESEALAGDILYALLKVEAYRLSIAPEFLANRNEIQKLIGLFVDDCHEETVAVLKGWRKDLIGNKLLRVLEGNDLQIKLDFKKDPIVQIFSDLSGVELKESNKGERIGRN